MTESYTLVSNCFLKRFFTVFTVFFHENTTISDFSVSGNYISKCILSIPNLYPFYPKAI